ncbi:MAG TPA: DUF87 domain-containing protein [Paraburkholderia sp.]|uniref:helicase HerA domain-containing protein n=1 Tax=Paraburkholderia sp. TaxID=1926495 RepID=UPI002B46B294|nr:DUF87 domain-containing protein [Paraburkholderia sp.]HKR47368.1 DUF87 domain-containing protein [Paraburkholderia sp.]
MAPDGTLGSRIVAQELLVQTLLSSAELVGGVYTMGFDECLVLTNDLWKKQAGGVPQHCFLLATAIAPGTAPDVEDEEVILLRVVGPAPLPAEGELVHVREQAMREMVTTRGEEGAAADPAILDVLTRNEIQFSALKAKVLGTFYETTAGTRSLLMFGSDVETFYSASRYKVYKPYGRSLAVIASFPEVTEAEVTTPQPSSRLQIGSIRYSSTNRRRKLGTGTDRDIAVPVRVNVTDFIAMKTAVFGMTRLGKSNTMKTIATAVFKHAVETNQPIGQLLFDPAGEYANVNVQDQTALAQIGPEHVSIYRYGETGATPGVRALSSNFFADDTISVTWQIINAYLADYSANYVKSFLSAEVVGPENEADDRSAFLRARRRRAALYATLLKAGFPPPANLNVEVAANAQVLTAINQQVGTAPQFQSNRGGRVHLSAAELTVFFDAVVAANAATPLPDNWIDPGLAAILAVYSGSVGSGFRLLQPLLPFHSTARQDDYASEILGELARGKIVIVDLSRGSETILQFCSERIINFIVHDAARRFAAGQQAHQIQVFIEEAHRLFDRDRMKVRGEVDPYVRLAKEAAKFKIGLIYATQEVSSVDPIILSNTSNWIVTHLNNHQEVKELSKYYDFEDFAELTLRAEDIGFARVKTRSGRYILPVQISKFSAEMINDARNAAQARRPS